MNLNGTRAFGRRRELAAGMTMIELIGVLAVIAVLAAVMVPVAIRTLDRIAREKEAASLKRLDEALQRSIIKTHSIPNQAGLAQFISTHGGIELAAVTHNLRKRARVLVIDAGTTLPTLPYTQSELGLTAVPDRARVMMISSIAKEMPFTDLDEDEFAALWDSPEGTLPVATYGDVHDVQIRRINLAPLFVKLAVSTYKAGTNTGYFRVDNATDFKLADLGPGYTAYYLKGTELKLHNGNDAAIAPTHRQILEEDTSFVYENDVWQSSIVGPQTRPGIGDLTGIVKAFLEAYPNTKSENYTEASPRAQQALVVQTMRDFMEAYNSWAAQSFSATAKTTLGLEAKRTAMLDAMQGLYKSGATAVDYSPPPNQTAPPPPLPETQPDTTLP